MRVVKMVKKDDVLSSKDEKDQGLVRSFERAAIGTSQMFAASLHDVRGAYENKKDSLTTLFDAAAKAKSDRNSWLGWSVVWAIFIPPVMAYTLYKAFDQHQDLSNLKKEVTREVESFRNKPSDSDSALMDEPVTPKTDSPFKTRIKPATPK